MLINGFKGSAVAAGIKKDASLDLGLIFSEGEAVAAGVFTSNAVRAAPVLLSQQHIKRGRARAILVNSGNANACTGKEGLETARLTADLVARDLGIGAEEVLVASTGVIGAPLDRDTVGGAIPGLVRALSGGGLSQVAEAIMTTDSFPKISKFQGTAGGRPFHILGMAKGAGMIMPQMATMLCFILSDIGIERSKLQDALSGAVEKTFNRITVDGDTSTNDTVFALANGTANSSPLSESELETFKKGMFLVAEDLARMIVKDGEGATKLVSVKVRGAASREDAEKASRTVANSALVKTAFYGQDPNWGRIMAALGRSGIHMDEEKVSIRIDDILVVEGGLATGTDQETDAAERMKRDEFTVTIDLNKGGHESRVLTCDLTHKYVSINAAYRT
ncbi:MAG: bifunctional glutamate N-acetyltransferase/amino-acid acetyltransferase ArgJ [Deltaproteobacteria bacterium]|nr:bifunctional glutamate N-acetyltransferase/amino-acid acetyltransferase ArgJ [Deltaproteobacteria bacterium]MBW2136542.1 bifunctional glutamate N-acetyltransferase/amino-acid acetyltransferase ArgJ [Deltaproteobacteria bacterium]